MSVLKRIIFLNLCLLSSVYCQQNTSEARSFQTQNPFCSNSDDFFKCIKLQALKATNLILNKSSFKLLDGIQIVSDNHLSHKDSRNFGDLNNKDLDTALLDNAREILSSQKVQINIPKLLSSGYEDGKRMIEARGKKYKKYLGPFVAALAIKGGILTMVYHSIAIIAGKSSSYSVSDNL